MGKGQVLFISVEGNDAALAEGLKAFQAGIALISGERTSPIEIAAPAVASAPELPENKQAEVTEIASAISNRNIARAVSKVRRATDTSAKSAGKARRIDPRVESGPLACDQDGCDRSFKSAIALGIHRRQIHGIASAGYIKKADRPAASQPDRETLLPCGVNGCLHNFRSHSFRERHWETKHPDKLRG